MSKTPRSVVTMRAGILSISEWESYVLKSSFIDPLGDFTLVCRPTRPMIPAYLAALSKGSAVTVDIDGAPQGTWIIQDCNRVYSKEKGCVIATKAHTPLITPYQGGVDPDLSLRSQTDTPLSAAVLDAFRPYGFTSITASQAANVQALSGKPISGRGPDVPVEVLKYKDATAKPGETAYELACKFFSRCGVALHVSAFTDALNPLGQLMLTAPDYVQQACSAVVLDFDGLRPGNRFEGEVEVTDSNDDQFSACQVNGLAAIGAVVGTPSGTSSSRPSATAVNANTVLSALPHGYSSSAAPFKKKWIHDKQARDNQQSLAVAMLALGIRAVKAFAVKGVVAGHVSSTGYLWQPDQIVSTYVAPDVGPGGTLDEDMWLLERVFTCDPKNGQKTHLTLLPKGALVLGHLPSSTG